MLIIKGETDLYFFINTKKITIFVSEFSEVFSHLKYKHL